MQPIEGRAPRHTQTHRHTLVWTDMDVSIAYWLGRRAMDPRQSRQQGRLKGAIRAVYGMEACVSAQRSCVHWPR